MIFGALIVILIAVALAILIIPVLSRPGTGEALNRDQQNIQIAREKKAQLEEQLAQQQMTEDEYRAALADLETSLALDLERHQTLQSNQDAGRWVIWVFAAMVPVLSVYMYWQLGEYRVIENPQLAQAQPRQTVGHGDGGEAPSIEEMIAKVVERLQQQPDDKAGWFILGRTYMTLQRYDEAVTAFQRSYEINQQEPTREPSIMLALADALAMTRDGDMTGEPDQLVKQALQLVPRDPTALWLAGLAAEQAGRNREAYDYWTALLPLLNDDVQSQNEVRTLLLALKQKQPDLPNLDFSLQRPTPGVNVSVDLDPQFADQADADDSVFIYAKAASGPPMPLAARRIKVSDLPLQVSLSDSDAMMPQMKLSGFDQVIVGARISKSGNPLAQSGDLYAESSVIDHKRFDGVVQISIDRVQP